MTWTNESLILLAMFLAGAALPVAIWAAVKAHKLHQTATTAERTALLNEEFFAGLEEGASSIGAVEPMPKPDSMYGSVRVSMAGRPATHPIELLPWWEPEPVAAENGRFPAVLRRHGLLLYLGDTWNLFPWHTVQHLDGEDINWDQIA